MIVTGNVFIEFENGTAIYSGESSNDPKDAYGKSVFSRRKK